MILRGERKLVWLDLCSGLGGASQPALDRGWKVIRVDIDPRFKPDIVADVRHLPLSAFKPFSIDVLWASPDCKDFSKWGMRCFNPNPPMPDLSVVKAVRSAILTLRPRYWFAENVWSSRPFLNPIFGRPIARPPGHVIWGNLGVLFPSLKPHKGSAGCWNTGRWGPTGKGGINAAESAVIPYEIGECICAAVERRVSEESATA